ncbi:MAG: trehalase family glycosidase [Bacteriovoracia bacterium]
MKRGEHRAIALLIFLSTLSFASTNDPLEQKLCSEFLAIQHIKESIAQPFIPSVYDMRISRSKPQRIFASQRLSPGLISSDIERARQSAIFEDFKTLSDARPKQKDSSKVALKALGLREKISEMYDFSYELQPSPLERPNRIISSSNGIAAALDFAEKNLERLYQRTPEKSEGSLLPQPYPGFVSATGRFQEFYYWDTYFITKHLFATKRLETIKMLVENFLESIRMFGFIPNGTRDYYLSRSQPPFLSSLIKELVTELLTSSPEQAEQIRQWLRARAYPLLKADYMGFWMNPKTRFDEQTGLNHHWDLLNLPRPERHSNDNEASLGKTFRDVRAAAESGLDFTETFNSSASSVAGVLLNSMLYKTEMDLAWIAELLGDESENRMFVGAATKRKKAMYKYMWNANTGRFENFQLEAHQRISVLSAETAVPLFVGLVSNTNHVRLIRENLLKLVRRGGLMATELKDSFHQWDGPNGWAPYQLMVTEGLSRYGYHEDARKIAQSWVSMVASSYAKTGTMFERMDVENVTYPSVDNLKYPVQRDFLWTSATFVWFADRYSL